MLKSEKQIVLLNQLISYFEIRNSESPEFNIIFLHGWRSNKEAILKVLSGIMAGAKNNGRNINFFSIDFPGFGKSPIPQKVFDLQNYTNIIKEFCGKLNLKNIILIGHSFGGRVSIQLASQNPGLVSKLILVDAAGIKSKVEFSKLKNIVSKLVKPFFNLKFMENIKKKIYDFIDADDYLAIPELKQTFVNIVNQDLTAAISEIKQTTLIRWGEKDLNPSAHIEHAKIMKEKIPNSILVFLKDAGHFSYIDKPEEFIKEVIEFI